MPKHMKRKPSKATKAKYTKKYGQRRGKSIYKAKKK